MKKVLVVAVLISCGFFLPYCNKSKIILPISPSKVTYKVDGILTEINGNEANSQDPATNYTGVYMYKIASPTPGNTKYVLYGQLGNPGIYIFFSIYTDTLIVGHTYHLTHHSDPDCVVLLRTGAPFTTDSLMAGYPTPYLDVTITTYNNAVISGTFSGLLAHGMLTPTTPNYITISEGAFKQVEVHY